MKQTENEAEKSKKKKSKQSAFASLSAKMYFFAAYCVMYTSSSASCGITVYK